jgi:acyl carrier protein
MRLADRRNHVEDTELLEQVREALTEILPDLDLSSLTSKTHLRDDLGIDSMMAVELAYVFTQRFKKDMPFERWYTGQAATGDYSVQSLMTFLRQHLG